MKCRDAAGPKIRDNHGPRRIQDTQNAWVMNLAPFNDEMTWCNLTHKLHGVLTHRLHSNVVL
jgi:hypothetical protein